ncbi:MAG: C-GCAxxG-C-C family protein [Promethearchaeota archaeon]|jgi:C_GCAxxG_C_C family probable redox protein
MSKVEQALGSFADGLSCSQSILSTFGPQLGLSRELALKIATGFGGGISRLGGVCGAVSGAVMAIGLKYGQSELKDIHTKEETYRITRQFLDEFKEKNGSIICNELLTCDINTPEGRKKAIDEGIFKAVCPQLVKDAAIWLEKSL